jgi:O-antigen ligase
MMLALPITSMPLVIHLVGSDSVGSPTILILLVLWCIWFIPYLLINGRFHKTAIPFLLFLAAAGFSSFLSLFMDIPAYKGHPLLMNMLQALVTLAIGASFYLMTSAWAVNEERIRAIIRWINWSGLVMVGWGLIQAVAWQTAHHWPGWLRAIQDIFSTGTLYRDRITSFALEPSWLAHQLNIIYLPIWLAATVKKYSAHGWRIWKIRFENILLVLGIMTHVLTLSRVALVTLLIMVALVMLNVHRWLVGKLANRGIRWLKIKVDQKGYKTWVFLIAHVLLVLSYITVLFTAVFALTKVDMRMQNLLVFQAEASNPLLKWAESIQIVARIVYWQAGWEIFRQHPWFGVGLGNAGYFIPETLNGFARKLIEVHDLMIRQDILLNVKNLWVRILAETGILGFSIITCWLYLMWRGARYLEKLAKPTSQMIGQAGIFILVGVIMEGFSIDSFAMPYSWIALGLISGACMSARIYTNQPED